MKKKETVAFIGPMPPPIGGVAVMNESFQNLLKKNYQITSYNTSKGEDREDLYNNNTIKKILPQLKKLGEFLKFANDSGFKVANLFVTSGVSFIREAIFIIILKIFNKRIIIHFHSKKKGEYFLSKHRIKILSLFINLADKIVVLSDDHFHFFKNHFSIKKMEVIENFVDYKLFNCSIETKEKEFLYVGRLSEKKGFFDLLKSIEILKNEGLNIVIHVLGLPDNDDTQQNIERMVKKMNLEEYLVFHGNTYGKAKHKLFKRCRYFIFPSQFENSPVVLKEAIASKMVIIASNIEANKLVLDVMTDYSYFEMGNYKDLSRLIAKCFFDEAFSMNSMNKASKIKIYDKNIAKNKLISLINNFYDEI